MGVPGYLIAHTFEVCIKACPQQAFTEMNPEHHAQPAGTQSEAAS